ncbi:hypothetical protein NC652_032516 [Populus alba x Populus x berolinensis]|nr:hypothetical protein NC652_032516 [Populus alba x Populus x berolinensis]
MENPNPILQNQEREICYFPAAHPYKVAREKQKQTLLPATINQSFSCSRATLSEHSRERASKILRDLERESVCFRDRGFLRCLMQSDLEVYQQKDQSM